MKIGKKIISFLLAVTLVVANMTSAFAWGGNKDQGTARTYNHIAIAVYTEDGGYYLAEKPHVYTEVEETYCTKCEEGKRHIFHNNKGTRTVTREIPLGSVQSSHNNGKEFQSSMNYSFTKDTVFTVTAKFTNGKVTTDTQTFTISNIENYKNSGKTFYEYCRSTYCDGRSGIDMKLSYEEIVENFYDVQYVVDGKVSTDITDGNDYKEGETVKVTTAVPSKEGYDFIGWIYGDKTYSAGNELTMPKGGITFTAAFVKVDGVAYDLNGGEGDISDNTSYRVGYDVTVSETEPVKEGYRFDGWTLNNDTETLYQAGDVVEMVEGGLTFKAQWTKLYNVCYYVDNTLVETKTFPEGTDVTNEVAYAYDLNDDSKTITDFVLETENANLASINSDLVYRATTSVKTFTVTYYVDGKQLDPKTYGYDAVVEYGSKVNVDAVSYTPDASRDFSGWKVTSGNVENVTTDIVISGTTTVKKFTVIYKVNGKTVETVENVEYGKKLDAFVFTPDEGYNVSEFTNLDKLASVTENVVLEATASLKTFTVVFIDEDGTELSRENYDYGKQIKAPDKPKKADSITDGDKATQTPAVWYKFNFNSWIASGDYTLDTTVTQDMTFTAKYNRWEVVVKYYVLDAGLAQPTELDHYPVANYSKGIVGNVYHFTEIANDDTKVAANLAKAPAITEFALEDKDGNAYTPDKDQYVKWYVLKKESDNWHVDGIVANQKYKVTVNYVDVDTNEKIAESKSETVAATKDYEIASPEVTGYELVNASESVVKGTMPYADVTVTIVYSKQETTTEETTTEAETEETTTEAVTEETTTETETEETTTETETEETTTETETEETTTETVTEETTTETVTEETTTETVTEETTTETVTEETTTETVTEETTTEAVTEETTTEAVTEETTTETVTEETTTEAATEESTTEEIIELPTEDIPLGDGDDETKPSENPTTEEATTEETTTVAEEESTTEEIIELPTEDIPLSDGSDIENSSNEDPSDDADSSDDDKKSKDDVKKNDEDANKPENEEIVDLADENIPLSDGTPKTGDTARNAGIIASMFAAVMGALAVAFGKKKNK